MYVSEAQERADWSSGWCQVEHSLTCRTDL